MLTQKSALSTFIFLLIFFQFSISQSESEKPFVVSSASIFQDMAANIGGDLIETASIVPIGGDPHIYEPTPGDVRLLLKADLILQNGLTFEGWINDLIKNSGSHADVVTITEGITPVTSEAHQNAVDPHAWMEPINGKIYSYNIKEALIRLIPDKKDAIIANYNAYISKLDILDAYIKAGLSKIPPEKRIIITSHDSFQYYGRRYGMRLESVLGTSTDADVQTSDLVRLNEVISESKVPAVFIESTINPKLLNQIASDNKIAIGGKLYSDSLGDKDSPADTYINMIRHNTDVIVSGLTAQTKAGDYTTAPTSSKWFIWIGVIFLATILLLWLFRKKPETT